MVIKPTSSKRATERTLISHESDLAGLNWSKKQPREKSVRPVESPNKIGFLHEIGPSHSPPSVNQTKRCDPPKNTKIKPLRHRSLAAEDLEEIATRFWSAMRYIVLIKLMNGGI